MLPPDQQPKTLDAAVQWVFDNFDLEALREFRSVPYEELIMYHHGTGRFFRNHFGLWTGNESLLRDACNGSKELHPDEASQAIIEAVWSRLQARP